jgi:hypothetical protein
MAEARSRHELTKIVVERKEHLFGQGDRKFNPQRSALNVVHGVPKGNEPSMALLRWAANATNAQIMAIVGTNSDYAFLYYK